MGLNTDENYNTRCAFTDGWIGRVLTPEEQAKLVAVLSSDQRRWLTFMLGTGLRVQEACAITPAEVRDGYVWVLSGKGGKPRQIPLRPEVEAVIATQLAVKGHLWNASPQYYRQVLRLKAKAAGIAHLWPHALRHTFGTRWLQAGGDIYKLSQVMGHSSVTMTERVYVHLLKEDLRPSTLALDLGTV